MVYLPLFLQCSDWNRSLGHRLWKPDSRSLWWRPDCHVLHWLGHQVPAWPRQGLLRDAGVLRMGQETILRRQRNTGNFQTGESNIFFWYQALIIVSQMFTLPKERTLIFPLTFRARASRSNYRIWLISTSQLSPPASTAQTLERMTLIVTATTPPTSADSEEKTKSFQPQILDLAWLPLRTKKAKQTQVPLILESVRHIFHHPPQHDYIKYSFIWFLPLLL